MLAVTRDMIGAGVQTCKSPMSGLDARRHGGDPDQGVPTPTPSPFIGLLLNVLSYGE